MPTHSAGLNDKHRAALALIEAGNASLTDIAKQVGFSVQYFHDLYEGDIKKAGTIATLFRREVDKLHAVTDKKIKHLSKGNRKLALELLNGRLLELKQRKHLTEDNIKEICAISNALGKMTPNVEIGQFSYTQGLSTEDLANEFRRLKSLVSTSQSGRIQPIEQDGSGEVCETPEPRITFEEES